MMAAEEATEEHVRFLTGWRADVIGFVLIGLFILVI
jgi:hypothetical protein